MGGIIGSPTGENLQSTCLKFMEDLNLSSVNATPIAHPARRMQTQWATDGFLENRFNINVEEQINAQKIIGHIVFGFTILLTASVAIERFYNANSRWRTLRSASLRLQTEVWKFRARVGPYAEDDFDHAKPVKHLGEYLKTWRASALTAADLYLTDLEKPTKDKTIYEHGQYKP